MAFVMDAATAFPHDPPLTDPLAPPEAPDEVGANRRASRFFHDRPRLALAGLLGPTLAWLLLIYVGSLALLVVTAFFELDEASQEPTAQLTLDNVRTAFTTWVFVQTVLRSVGVAAAVTVICLLVGLPLAFYIAKVARPWARRGLVVAVVLPLWAGYLVKGYAWRAMLEPGSEFGINASGGFLKSTIGWSPGFGLTAIVITLAYLWLPYMVLPIYAGLERLPESYLDASGDLGARPLRTFTSVTAPLLVPSIAAGSIFTFCLSLGDYITPRIVGGKVQLIGNLIERTLLAPNQPLAAAFTLWPMLIILVYLFTMSRLGAFESL
jgi:putative spermidine/putrescine transport system permease protein